MYAVQETWYNSISNRKEYRTMNQNCLTWLPFLPEAPSCACHTPLKTAQAELEQGLAFLQSGLQTSLVMNSGMGDGFRVECAPGKVTITGGETGLLYGAYRVLMALAIGEKLPKTHEQKPFYALRMLNCWDNAEGAVERGYAGRSLFFEDGRLDYDPARIRQLARMLASVGVNAICINNVNVHAPAHKLIEEEWLPHVAELAALFRPFGVRLLLSVDYAHPLRHGIPTADPLDEQVQAWWKKRAEIVYRYIPDLAGFVVKADSEHRPGPFTYGRNHAEGANMLARALKPFGGQLVWRCFVYNCMQDWRDTQTDRPKAAYEHYAWLDGQFDDNVILQIKHGPYDFQVREPVSPLLFAMRRTNMAMELQLAQEYTGHQIDLYAMPPMWQEIFDDLPKGNLTAITAVGNLGRDCNYTGHPFAAVNLFGYGMMAWDPDCDPEDIIRTWAKLTYHLPENQENTMVSLLMGSRRTYEKYTSPLALCWMVNPHVHYGPNPEGYEFSPWGTFHRATRDAVGIDRTSSGTGYTLQYPEPLRSLYEKPETTPDLLKLFFHRLRYDYVMDDGRTLIQRIYDDHFEGYEEAEAMAAKLQTLDLPSPDREEAGARMQKQLQNARDWRDIINTYFRRMSGAEDAKGRKIYE